LNKSTPISVQVAFGEKAMLRLRSVSVRSIGWAWIYSAIEVTCFESVISFTTGDFIADTIWHSGWTMLVVRSTIMALIAVHIGRMGAGSSGEITNGACSALLITLWLLIVFLNDRWPMSEGYLIAAGAMPLLGMIGGLIRRRENWHAFELPRISARLRE